MIEWQIISKSVKGNVDYIYPKRKRLTQKSRVDYPRFETNTIAISCPLNRKRLRGKNYGLR